MAGTKVTVSLSDKTIEILEKLVEQKGLKKVGGSNHRS